MVAEKINYRIGEMEKSPWNMSDSEFEVWKEECKIKTRDYLFSIGQPLVHIVDNKTIIENPDGTIEYLK
jgi:hypothetical protein